MTLQLRQICLVARKLAPAIDDLETILGIESCYVDDGVAHFGLENTLMPVGHNFLEVVAPIEEHTAAGRYLDRRGGDGGYMVICQANSRDTQQAVRQGALDSGIRVAHEAERSTWNICQLHPRDMIAAFLEVDWDEHDDFDGNWMPAGGTGWQAHVRRDRTKDFVGVELQGDDPLALADIWSRATGLPVTGRASAPAIELNNATLRFVEATDGRGPGLGGIDVAVADRDAIVGVARARNARVGDDWVEICGTRFYLRST